MKIAIYGKSFGSVFNDPIAQFVNTLTSRGHELVIFSDLAPFLAEAINFESRTTFSDHHELKGCEMVVSIGGDGTILNTLLYVRDSNIPVLGLNTGRLGFLSTVNTDDIDDVVAAIEEGSYVKEERTVLQLKTREKMFEPLNYALNEVAVHKNDISSMITISAYVNDVYINSYWADGLIISTATGSTAYNLSCGGPIVMPGSQTLVITPIAPHNLNIRPLVIPDSANIRLEIEGRESQHLVSLDSRSQALDNSQTLEICKAPFSMQLLRVQNLDFMQTIRNKLNWGLDRRN